MKNIILKPIIKGALILFPIVLTVWLVGSLVFWIDNLGRKLLEPFLLDHLILPGSGLLIIFLVLWIMGILFKYSYFKIFFKQFEHNILKFPLVNTLYSAIKDLANMFKKDDNNDQQVVFVNLDSLGLGNMIGVITNNEISNSLPLKSLSEDQTDKQLACVYLPMSYMVGGFTLIIDKDRLTHVDMSFEDAMRFALTAGVSQAPSK